MNRTPARNAKPFLKWVGGKQQLLSQFEFYFPKTMNRYFEPFVGGGAVFFHLWNIRRLPQEIFLFDNNDELINAYLVVRDAVDELIKLLADHKARHGKEYYYSIRDLDRSDRTMSAAIRAARTFYLNKTCFNGLFRVNSKGQFNVPMGSYVNPSILQENVLRAASAALQGCTLEVHNFQEIVPLAYPGDFFYFDPPYSPLSKTSSFTSYTAGNFGDRDQRNLAETFAQLTEKKCLCMLSNSYTPFITELYREFRIEIVQAKRAVNSDANGRGYIPEVVVLNY
ncbi:MAG: DNA adenine methylase [Candidatus Latescibacterota bacterium]